MKRSLNKAAHRGTYKSWLRRALPLLALLVAFDIAINAWQSWHDFRASDALAAQRLDVQTALIAGRVEDRVRDVNAITTEVGEQVEAGRSTDASLENLSEAFERALGHTLIGIFDPSDGHLFVSSRPEILNGAPSLQPFIAKVRANPSQVIMVPVPWGERGALVVVKGHQNRAATLDAIIVLVISFEQPLITADVNLVRGTAILLRDGQNRVIMRYPLPPNLSVGQILPREGEVRGGPTAATQFVRSQIDDIDRLVSSRRIALGLTPDYWTLNVGYAVDNYRASYWTSLYLNLGAAVVVLALLAGGMQLIRREREFESTVATIVENIPTPVAVVDLETEGILMANEALITEFGAVAGAGQPFSRLFVDPENWPEARTTRMDEAIPMLARDGTRHMLVHCTQLEFHGKADEATSGTLLVTLVDVTRQQQLLKQLRTEADFDPLTGLANRRYFERAAQKAVAHAQQQPGHLSLLALDLDFFKRVNDTYGHAAGDRVLQVVARLFEGVLRDTDLAARLGGEEFAAILLDTPLEQARAVAERIRAAVQGTPIVLESGQTISQTVSIGIAAYSQSEPDLAATHERADAALYGAKGAGRNRVQIFVPETPASQETS